MTVSRSLSLVAAALTGTFAVNAGAAVLTNPAIAPGSILAWADSVPTSGFAPGPQNITVIGSPPAASGVPGNALGAQNGTIVSLGDGGAITLSFSTAIRNGAGADFAVFENAFASAGLVFAELGFVAVSTDGVSFATFATRFDNPTINEGFGSGFRLIDIQQVNNFAGIHNTGVGTGFNLDDLTDSAEVLGGLVNLDLVRYVRITDAVGNGSTFDSLGNPIFDPFPTPFASGGLDLDAVGALHVVPLPPSALMLGGALITLGGCARRRRSSRPAR